MSKIYVATDSTRFRSTAGANRRGKLRRCPGPPGELITAQDARKVEQLVSPGVYLRVTHGMSMQIVPSERIEWPPPYREATEKYSAQVRLSSDHRSLNGYVAGLPFPFIDPNDRRCWNQNHVEQHLSSHFHR